MGKREEQKSEGPLSIFVRFGIGATIHIGREIQCLTYSGFSVVFIEEKKKNKVDSVC